MIGSQAGSASTSHARRLQTATTDVGFEVFRWIAIVVLVALSGTFSGLTLGLLGLDTNQLAIVAESGAPSKKRDALIIQPLRKRGNLLLCTLLLGNVAVNSALSILMSEVTGSGGGFVISTAVIVVFGEILPQATCSRFPLYVGARSVPLVQLFMLALLPLTWPLSKALDWLLGKEVGDFYEPNEFDTLIRKHAENSTIGSDPARIMQGALRMSDKRVKDVMTPRSETFSLLSTARLDYDTMAEIFRQGYSRVPIFDADDPDKLTGMLYAKDLMLLVPAKKTPVATVVAFFNRDVVMYLNAEDRVDDAFRSMLASKRHIAMVHVVDDADGTRDPVLRVGGILTMEDIIEIIIQADVSDEYDVTATGGTSRMGTEQLRALTDVSKGFNDLDPSMVRAVTAHLTTNIGVFKNPHPATGSTLSLEAVSELVQGSRVVELVAPPDADMSSVAWLYTRGDLEDVCSVILEGEVEMFVGDDEIRVVRSTYDVLAERAVLSAAYRSDFSARPLSRVVRMLRLTRNDVEEAFRMRRGPGGLASGDAGVAVLSHADVAAAGRAPAVAEPRSASKAPLLAEGAAGVGAGEAGPSEGGAAAEGDDGRVSPGRRTGSADDLMAAAAASGAADTTRGRSSSMPKSPTAAGLVPRSAALATGPVPAVVERAGMRDAGLFQRYSTGVKQARRAPAAAAGPAPAPVPGAASADDVAVAVAAPAGTAETAE